MSDHIEVIRTERISAERARWIIDTLKAHARSDYDLLVELHDCYGWLALGYESWRACVTTEFGAEERTLYRRLSEAKVLRELESADPVQLFDTRDKTANESERPDPAKQAKVSGRQLAALAKAPEGTRAEVLEVAAMAAEGAALTEAVVKAAVDAKIAEPDAPRERLVKAAAEGARKPRPVVKTPPLDPDAPAPGSPLEEAMDAPTDGASLVEAVREEYEERAAKVDELPDDEWLAMQPLSRELSGHALKKFQAAALFYRDFERQARRSLARWLAGAKRDRFGRSSQSYLAFRLEQALKVGPPASWKRCADVSDGGCAGTGQAPMVGECPECRGRGYIER